MFILSFFTYLSILYNIGAMKLNTHEKSRLFCYTSSGSTKPKLHQDWGKIKSLSEGVGGNHPWLPDLFESMTRRIEAVIKAGGGHTKY